MSDISRITALREERFACITDMRRSLDAADEDGRDLTSEESAEYDKREARIAELDTEIERRERIASLTPNPALTANADTADAAADGGDGKRSTALAVVDPLAAPEYRGAFYKLAAFGGNELTADEKRALTVGSNTAGGYTVPTTLANRIVEQMRQFGVMRQLSYVFQTEGGGPLNIPTVTAAGFGAGTWIAESGAYGGTDPAFGTAQLLAYKGQQLAIVSEELLQDSAFDIEGLLARYLGQNLGVLQNTAYVVGTGPTTQPTGITTQTTAGKTGLTGQTTSVIADDIFDLYHSVVPGYRPRGSWVMHDTSIRNIRKLKDSQNRYLWEPSLTAGDPDLLVGRPVYADPDVPVMAANAKSILFGDFSGYWIRDSGAMSLQRLNELYAANGQVGFRLFARTDGKLIDTISVKHYANSAT